MEALELADWRRAVAELYAEVRATAATDPAAAWDRWRLVRERLYREHPQSPVPVDARGAFRAHHWPYDPRLRFTVPLEADVAPAPAAPAAAAVPWSAPAHGVALLRLGTVSLPLPAGPARLPVLRLADYAGGLLLAFRDATNGVETYGAGRYVLDTAKGADLGGTAEELVVDLNFAYHPSCAFDPRWACPLAPADARIDGRIAAGERLDRPADGDYDRPGVRHGRRR